MPFSEVRTRFAPSPTGYMHVGNLRTALYAFLLAKSNNGKFILRIEDTDQDRYIEGAVDLIYNTLEEVGIKYDEGPNIGGEFGPYIQSERKDIYIGYAKKLIETGYAYYCFCDKERLTKLREKCEKEKVDIMYDRHCLNLSKEEIDKNLKEGKPYVIRQKMPKEGTTTFNDAVFGPITIENNTLEDHVLIKSDGLPTYNFANVIDDHLMKISHVIRGSEYLSSTPKYNLLYKAFGWELPTYVHVSPVMKDEKKKLSKREGDASYGDFIKKGYLPEAIVNYIALLGWSPGSEQEIFTMNELINLFDIKGISKSPAIFDENKLRWMNGEYIRKLSLDDFHSIALKYYNESLKNSSYDLKKISILLHKRLELLTEIPEKSNFFLKLPDYSTELYIHKKMKTTKEIALESLKNVLPIIEKVNNWENDNLFNTLKQFAKDQDYKNGQVLWPIRTALSGLPVTPGGATELAEILGKDETIKRIKIGINILSKELGEEE